ncbi:hypothetical protein ACU5AX_02050 [Sphingomonas sp. XXL09]|uniref:hypothetical protein n=1 Tax=Sphingomonas sp. XXL09 TaxID=3457787 RepID=UPI00406BCD6B
MKTIRVQDTPAAAWGNVVGIPPHMTNFVARIERQAQMDPRAYRRRVAIAGLLGYVVIGGLVLIALGLAAACVGLIIYAPQAVGFEIKLLLCSACWPSGSYGHYGCERNRPRATR